MVVFRGGAPKTNGSDGQPSNYPDHTLLFFDLHGDQLFDFKIGMMEQPLYYHRLIAAHPSAAICAREIDGCFVFCGVDRGVGAHGLPIVSPLGSIQFAFPQLQP